MGRLKKEHHPVLLDCCALTSLLHSFGYGAQDINPFMQNRMFCVQVSYEKSSIALFLGVIPNDLTHQELRKLFSKAVDAWNSATAEERNEVWEESIVRERKNGILLVLISHGFPCTPKSYSMH